MRRNDGLEMGPSDQKAPFLLLIQIPPQKFITVNITSTWSAIAFFLTSWFSGKTDCYFYGNLQSI